MPAATASELRHLDDTAYHTTLDVLIQVAGDPGILGMSSHLLYIGRRSPLASLDGRTVIGGFTDGALAWLKRVHPRVPAAH